MSDRLTMLETKFESTAEDIREMKSAVGKIAESLHKLTAMEERHIAMHDSLRAIQSKTDDQDKRLDELEKSETLNRVMRYVGGSAGLAVLTFVGNKVLGLL